MLNWGHVDRHLRNSRSYWLTTVREDGRPHAMPVWGVWDGRALWFGTGPASIKGRNIERDPRVVMHLESGDDVVILEGTIGRTWSDEVLDTYVAKYSMPAEELGFQRARPTACTGWSPTPSRRGSRASSSRAPCGSASTRTATRSRTASRRWRP